MTADTLEGRPRTTRAAVGLAACGALALALSVALPTASAQAQFLRSWGWHPDEGPPPIPPDDVGEPPPTWRTTVPDNGLPPGWHVGPEGVAGPMTVTEIRRRASIAGFRLLGTPRLKGHVYIAFGEDAHGLLHHLAFDSYEGKLVENETSQVTAKATIGHPTAPPSPAVTPTSSDKDAASRIDVSPKVDVAPKIEVSPKVELSPNPVEKPPAAAPTVTARELSPIKPQPGVKLGPTPQDADIDKD